MTARGSATTQPSPDLLAPPDQDRPDELPDPVVPATAHYLVVCLPAPGTETLWPAYFARQSQRVLASALAIRMRMRRLGGRETGPDVCPLCRQALVAGEQMTRAFSQGRLFPNCMLHTVCIQWEALATTAAFLRNEWHAAQARRAFYAVWD